MVYPLMTIYTNLFTPPRNRSTRLTGEVIHISTPGPIGPDRLLHHRVFPFLMPSKGMGGIWLVETHCNASLPTRPPLKLEFPGIRNSPDNAGLRPLFTEDFTVAVGFLYTQRSLQSIARLLLTAIRYLAVLAPIMLALALCNGKGGNKNADTG